MEDYKKRFARFLAQQGAILFRDGLRLKDGRPTPYFINMGVFSRGRASLKLGSFYAEMMKANRLVKKTDIVFGPSYKGSAIAQATAIALSLKYKQDVGFAYDRKEVKAHGEASKKGSMLVGEPLRNNARIFIVDDVATTLTTKLDVIAKIKAEAQRLGVKVKLLGVGIGVDREQTTAVYDKKGRVKEGVRGKDPIKEFRKKTGLPVYRIAGVREIFGYLAGRKIGGRIYVTQKDYERFLEYDAIYGTR
jgi:orotate phosphoribosyltransferase